MVLMHWSLDWTLVWEASADEHCFCNHQLHMLDGSLKALGMLC